MYNWLREQLDKTEMEGNLPMWAGEFIDYLERTGATPCDDCECMKAFVLQELRRGNFTEGSPPKDVA